MGCPFPSCLGLAKRREGEILSSLVGAAVPRPTWGHAAAVKVKVHEKKEGN